MNKLDYDALLCAFKQYYETGKFPLLSRPVKINSVNKKQFGWQINCMNKMLGNGKLNKEILLFAKQNISLFTDISFDEENIYSSNLYKYFTTKYQ